MYFLLIAGAFGFAAFSRLRISLPLFPLTASILITPARPSVTLDEDLIATYLVYALPAMIFALAIAARSRTGRILQIASAFLLQVILSLTWPSKEPFIRSAGALYMLGTAALLLFLILILEIRTRVFSVMGLLDSHQADEPGQAGWYISRGTLQRFSAILCAVLMVLSAVDLYAARAVPRQLSGFARPIILPASWIAVTSGVQPGTFQFTMLSRSPRPPKIIIEADHEFMEPNARIAAFASSAGANLKSFSARKPEFWNSRLAGAMAQDFMFEAPLGAKDTVYLAGTRAILPLSESGTLTVTLLAAFDDWQQQRWDLVRMASELGQNR